MSEKSYRKDIRNIAIIAHVDHGKTTLVDAILRQTHVHRNIAEMGERIMDSMDLERERGITIRAKNASVTYKNIKINIVDTPGHADFGGEVERTLRMVDGVLLLVDAKDGPMPQTRFVLKKALELGHKAIVVINKIDTPDARPDEVSNKTFDLFCELNAHEHQLDFPIVYTSALQGTATLDLHQPSDNISPLLDAIIEHIPAPQIDLNAPLQILILALLADSYKGTMGIGKISAGSIKKNDNALLFKKNQRQITFRVTSILNYQGLERVEINEASAGEIVAIAGFDGIGIGDTITDPNKPSPLPPPVIDEPTVQMMFAVNTSPFAGREGRYVTSRALRERLFKELETNVSLRLFETNSPDTFLVAGRGELHLAILIETMRREGFELQVSQPEVIFKQAGTISVTGQVSQFYDKPVPAGNGTDLLEPFEFLIIDVPQEYQGAVIEEVGKRKAMLTNMIQAPTGEIHLEYQISTRGVIGLKGILMTKTRGTAIVHHVFDEYKPVEEGGFAPLPHGSLISSENGTSNAYGLNNCEERGELFIGPGAEVYEGMIIGENSRPEDLMISPCKTKKLTNMRASGTDEAIILTPPKEMNVELAIEYIGPDELVEITPKSIRLRKKLLDPTARKRLKKQGT